MTPFYRLSKEDWDHFENDGFIGIICWDGILLSKPGFKPIYVPHSEPEARIITENEADRLVSMVDKTI